MNKTIVITGANGFIGRYLTEYFAHNGYQVTALIHSKLKYAIKGVSYRQFDMDSFSTDLIPNEVTAVVHCAYIPYKNGNNSDDRNLRATERLLEICRKRKVGKFVFLSSFSAKANALSHYGRNKFALEQLFDTEKDLILRPALVEGNGGLWKKMEEIIRANKVIPLIDGGKQAMQTINIELLAKIIQGGIEKNISGIYDIAENEAFTMKDVYRKMAAGLDKKIHFLTIPYFVANLIVKSLALLTKEPPITIENLNGLKQSAFRKPTDMRKFLQE